MRPASSSVRSEAPKRRGRAVASGVDVIVAQGWEAGGHVTGSDCDAPVVPAVVDAWSGAGPVIAAGGIKGRMVAALAASPRPRRPGGVA